LFAASSLRDMDGDLKTVLDRSRGPTQRLNRGFGGYSSKDQIPIVDVCLRANGYTVGRNEHDKLFRKIDLLKLDLAEGGDELLDPVELVDYPFNVLFTEPCLRQCMVPPSEVEKAKGGQTLCLAPGTSRPDFIRAIRHMCYFSTERAFLGAPKNGGFAYFKKFDGTGQERNRFIFNGVNGNSPFSMTLLEGVYRSLVAADPEAAALLGCGPKAMNIASPTNFCDMPPGASSRSSSDFKSYFFQFAQLPFLLRYQGLCNVPGHEVGMPEAETVRVGLKVLAMGNWMAALIAHAAHWCILNRGLVRRPLRFFHAAHSSVEHREDLGRAVDMAAASDDGMVAWKDLPERMRRRFVAVVPGMTAHPLGSSKLEELRVPLCALRCEPTRDVKGRPVGEWYQAWTTLIGGSRNGRAAVEAMRRENRSQGVDTYAILCTVYQDDQHSFTFGPWVPKGRDVSLEVAAGHRLVTTLVTDAAGLRQNFSKMEWPTRQTRPVLGIDAEFLPGPERLVRFSMSPGRRGRIAQEIEAIIALSRCRSRRPRMVSEDLMLSLVGDLVWCFLVKRPLLSCLQIVFRALQSKNRPEGLVLLTLPLLSELRVAAGLLCFAESVTADFVDTLWAFDASGKSHWGNGGYGVVYRRGLTQEVATEITTPAGPTRLSEFRIQEDGTAPAVRLNDRLRRAPAARAAEFMKFQWHRGTGPWEVARHGEFKTAPRIVMKSESLAGEMSFGCASRKKSDRGKLVALVGDNTGSLHGLAKGRSRVKDLNVICARMAARQILTDMEARWAWINSAAMPADYPK
jgi:hypothetical protein